MMDHPGPFYEFIGAEEKAYPHGRQLQHRISPMSRLLYFVSGIRQAPLLSMTCRYQRAESKGNALIVIPPNYDMEGVVSK